MKINLVKSRHLLRDNLYVVFLIVSLFYKWGRLSPWKFDLLLAFLDSTFIYAGFMYEKGKAGAVSLSWFDPITSENRIMQNLLKQEGFFFFLARHWKLSAQA